MILEFLKKIAAMKRGRPDSAAEVFPAVTCFSWRPRGDHLNFGDHLAEVIVDAVLATQNLTRFEEVRRPARLFSVGSVLHFAREGDTVWGSGVNGKIAEEAHRFQNLDVRAVRGPLTAEFLRRRGISVPDIYGDPALLLPRLMEGRFQPSGEDAAIFVPNLNDLGSFESPVPVVSPLRGWNHVVSRIVRARLVLASSLHGLVLAEAFGIPARYVRLSNKENLFKYNDYYLGSGRGEAEFATTIEQGLEMGGVPPLAHDGSALLNAFPFDLWEPPLP